MRKPPAISRRDGRRLFFFSAECCHLPHRMPHFGHRSATRRQHLCPEARIGVPAGGETFAQSVDIPPAYSSTAFLGKSKPKSVIRPPTWGKGKKLYIKRLYKSLIYLHDKGTQQQTQSRAGRTLHTSHRTPTKQKKLFGKPGSLQIMCNFVPVYMLDNLYRWIT